MSTTIQPSDTHQLIVALDDIRSHHNVGALFRSADAFGIDELLLGGITPRPPHRDIQKSALGATESVKHSYHEVLADTIEKYKAEGFTIMAIEQTEEALALEEAIEELKGDTLFIVGNEVKGVSDALLKLSDYHAEIQQYGAKKSINVSVCGGICMHLVAKKLRLIKR